MADYDTLYSFPSLVGGEVGWDYVGPDYNDLRVRNTDGAWCWTDTGSVSSGTGPPSGIACVYTETSPPVAGGDEFFMTLTDPVSAALYALYVTFDICKRGNTSAHIYFEAWNGTAWAPIADWQGDGVTTFTSVGPYDFTGYTNADFKIRFRTVVGGTPATNDMAVDQVRIYGDLKPTYKLEGVTKDNDGSVLGSCKCYLFKDNQDNTLTYVGYDQSDGSGNYSLVNIVDSDAQYIVVAWKDNTPHVFDVSDHVLEPVEE